MTTRPAGKDQRTAMAKSAGVRRIRGWRRAGLVLSGVVPALALLPIAAAQAALVDEAGTATATVGNAAEAWYADAPVDICTTPLGCAPGEVPSSPYPPDTLHVGVAGGQERARTYLLPDLVGLPYGATVLGGTMTLPVALATEDGTQSPELAKIEACLATGPVADGTEGSTAKPPTVDCKVSAPLDYDAKKSVFTLQLTPLLAETGGLLTFGIALVPDSDKTALTDAWHVTFNGRGRADADHISTLVTYQRPAPQPPTSGGDTTGSGTVVDDPPLEQPPAVPVPGVGLPNPVEEPADQAPPQVAPPAAAPVAQPVAFSREFQYPMAFLMPLALLIGAVFFVRLFTRDATPMRVSARVGP
jgi:hypothetical protein